MGHNRAIRNSYPTKYAVYSHWKNWLDKNEIPKFICGGNANQLTDSMSVKETNNGIYWCFACGKSGEVERAHINVRNSENTNSTVENIHLLCGSCHYESEGYSGELYFDWIKQKESDIKRLLKIIKMFHQWLEKENLLNKFNAECSLITNNNNNGQQSFEFSTVHIIKKYFNLYRLPRSWEK